MLARTIKLARPFFRSNYSFAQQKPNRDLYGTLFLTQRFLESIRMLLSLIWKKPTTNWLRSITPTKTQSQVLRKNSQKSTSTTQLIQRIWDTLWWPEEANVWSDWIDWGCPGAPRIQWRPFQSVQGWIWRRPGNGRFRGPLQRYFQYGWQAGSTATSGDSCVDEDFLQRGSQRDIKSKALFIQNIQFKK